MGNTRPRLQCLQGTLEPCWCDGVIVSNEKASVNYTSEFINRLYSEAGKDEFRCRMNVLGHMQQVVTDIYYILPSVLWRCWLGVRKGIRSVKTEWWGAGVVICLEQGADLHTAQLMPLPLTVSCFSKIQIGFTFLVPAHPGSPGQRAVKLGGCT